MHKQLGKTNVEKARNTNCNHGKHSEKSQWHPSPDPSDDEADVIVSDLLISKASKVFDEEVLIKLPIKLHCLL